MAGLGRRTFAPGEVLTASNVMNYLQDQVVQNYAGTAARGSAIGTAISEGMVSYIASSDAVEVYNGSSWQNVGLPAGAIQAFAMSTAPAGWITADGAALSRTTYATLFAAIGTSFGAGNGSTTFNVPDLRGRTVIAPDAGAGRVGANNVFSQASGAQSHTLTVAEMPSHSHTIGTEFNVNIASSTSPRLTSGGAGASSGLTGGGGAHNNMQPYIVLNYCIKL